MKEVSEISDLSDANVCKIQHDHLRMKKRATWVLQHLSAVQHKRVECALSVLLLYGPVPKVVLEKFVTDENS